MPQQQVCILPDDLSKLPDALSKLPDALSKLPDGLSPICDDLSMLVMYNLQLGLKKFKSRVDNRIYMCYTGVSTRERRNMCAAELRIQDIFGTPQQSHSTDKRFMKAIDYQEWKLLETPKSEIDQTGVCISWESLDTKKYVESSLFKGEVKNFLEHKAMLAILWMVRLRLNSKYSNIPSKDREKFRTEDHYIKCTIADAISYLKIRLGERVERTGYVCTPSLRSETSAFVYLPLDTFNKSRGLVGLVVEIVLYNYSGVKSFDKLWEVICTKLGKHLIARQNTRAYCKSAYPNLFGSDA